MISRVFISDHRDHRNHRNHRHRRNRWDRWDHRAHERFAGVIEIVGALQEGFHNVPQLYGSKVRKEGRVKDFQSGVREGAKVG